MTQIAIKYVGPRDFWTDHLYDTGLTFTKGGVLEAPAWAAALLLKHPEFQDARPKAQRGQPITEQRPPREYREEDMRELEEIGMAVRLDVMTKDQLATHAMRSFGVRIDNTQHKAAMMDTVRTLSRQRAA